MMSRRSKRSGRTTSTRKWGNWAMAQETVSADHVLSSLLALVTAQDALDKPLGRFLLETLGIHPTLGDISILAEMSNEEMLSRIRKHYAELR